MNDKVKTNKKREVKDERGNVYLLKGLVGEGGQGVVCKTDHKDTLVKICKRPKAERQNWMEHIRWLMQQDLDSLNIARPVARIVSPQPGYVMELMDGLQPLQVLIEETEIALQEQDIQSYLDQGGIRRRLILLAKLARTLAKLHGRGMAFGDLSPANIFISNDSAHSEVWLIDCDNISVNQRVSYDIPKQPLSSPKAVYTKSYGAPEIVKGEEMISSLTDSWSFAIIAFRLLTALHPFIGDTVSDGEPELEEEAFKGALPWVDHPNDSSNRVTMGLPRDMVVLKPLADLFEQCFNAGRDTPALRPSLNEWAEKLEHISEWLVDCPSCNSSYYYTLKSGALKCSFCETLADSKSLIFLRHYILDESILELEGASSSDCYVDTGLRQVLNVNSAVSIKTSPPGSGFYQNAKTLYEIEFSNDRLLVKPNSNGDLRIRVGSSKPQAFSRPFSLKTSDRKSRKIYLITGDESKIQDVCIFKW